MALGGNAYNVNKDFEVPHPPNDGISSVSWSKQAHHLAVSSWDNSVRVYDVAQQGGQVTRANPVALSNSESPVLCTAWSGDGKTVFYGGVDGKLKMWSVGMNTQATTLGTHAAGIRSVAVIDELGVVCTGSWDKTLRYWDGRSPQPSAVVQLPERCYALDVCYPLSVVATASTPNDKPVIIYDLTKPQTPWKNIQSPLKYQTRCIACFPDKTGFAIGSIEGRVGIHHVDEKDQPKNFAFKCHRENNDIYAVNSISFHQTYGTFATTGADGTVNFWDKEQKQRLKPFAKAPTAVPCGNFSADGLLYAYAVSYDWSKGSEHYNPQTMKNYVFIHPVTETEIKSRNANRAKR